MTDLAARLRLVATAVLFSTGGAAIKSATLTGWQVASFRSGVAALTVWLLVPAARARWSPRVLAVALVYAATMVLFVVANNPPVVLFSIREVVKCAIVSILL